ncbi:hypothetical protein [Capnocytophaga gingivalis]|uniref:hypothetical protein n=1 Tax=Capnocytophaga gingivalis TaxID=1017 RepID=UPI00288BBA4A|nr:hypothetical protein [Capnocytophaga gingivalis]
MKEESDIPLLKSYNKGTTVIEADPFMEKEIDELIRAYAKPQEIIRRLRDVGYSEEEVRQSYKFQFYCEILKQIQKDKEEKTELRLSIPFIVSLVVFSLFSLAATIGIFFSVYFIFLALPLWVLTYGFYKLNKLSIIIWGIFLLILSILGCIALFSGSGKVFAAFVPVGTALLNYLADLLKRS